MKTYGLPYKGSKDKIADKICSLFPIKENFYDLFMGGVTSVTSLTFPIQTNIKLLMRMEKIEMRNHKIFKKYKDALSYANDLINGIKGEVLFDDAWDDYLINGENTGDCKIYKNGKFIKTINTDDNYK